MLVLVQTFCRAAFFSIRRLHGYRVVALTWDSLHHTRGESVEMVIDRKIR